MTIVENTRPVTGGVDTHADVHVAAAVDGNGGVLGVESFTTTPTGFRELHGWLAGFGELARVGVEGTGAYGAGLARYLRSRDLEVIEVDRPNRQLQRRAGKSDTIDAIEAARAALSGRASGIVKSADGDVEAIRVLLVARRSAREVRIKYLNQIRHLGFTAPDELRERLRGVSRERLARTAASLRPIEGTDTVLYATNSRSEPSADASSISKPTPTASISCSRPSLREGLPASVASTAWGSTAPRFCSSPRATTRTGSAAKPRSRTSAASPRCPRRQARPTDTGSTPPATAKPTMRSGGLCSPA